MSDQIRAWDQRWFDVDAEQDDPDREDADPDEAK
jgi:hypothetical protein